MTKTETTILGCILLVLPLWIFAVMPGAVHLFFNILLIKWLGCALIPLSYWQCVAGGFILGLFGSFFRGSSSSSKG